VLEEGSYDSIRFSEIMELVDRYATLLAARQKAQQFADTARKCLDGLPDSPYKDALRSLPEYIVERES